MGVDNFENFDPCAAGDVELRTTPQKILATGWHLRNPKGSCSFAMRKMLQMRKEHVHI